MSNFENVTVVRNANVYFDGNVTSRTVVFPSGEQKTLGIMMPGSYHFDTVKKELMEIQTGEVKVLLPGESEWQSYVADISYEVPADSAFDIEVLSITDYCCSYLENG